MSEADRVFARMTTSGALPSPEYKQFLHVTSRRRGAVAGQSRVVEVVHRRSNCMAAPAEPAYAATWPEGFQGRSAPTLPPAEDPAASPVPAPPVGHLMPGWEPLLPPLQPIEPAAKIPASIRPQPRAAKPKQSKNQPMSIKRTFADPFAADDSGTNCIRCGYLVSPAREKRGLITCLQCR
jgi:cell division septation protein DedD